MIVFLSCISSFVVRVLFLGQLLCFYVSAGIFNTQKEMEASQVRADELKDEIMPGKIVLKNQENGDWLDYASATLIGKPGDKESITVLSCAHFYFGNLDFINSSLNLKFYFYDYNGAVYDIDNIIPYPINGDNLNSYNDIALFHLKLPIPLKSSVQITREFSLETAVRSLSAGWSVISDEFSDQNNIVSNIYGEKFQCLENTLNKYKSCRDIPDLYVHKYTADRLLNTSNLDVFSSRYHYLADSTFSVEKRFHQPYYHDSGSSWFSDDILGGYSLVSLTSRSDFAYPIEADNSHVLKEWNFDFFQDRFVFQMVKHKNQGEFNDIFTPLQPHRDWIYLHVL